MTLDNFRSQKIIWDRANKQIFEKIEANSGDSNGRKLVVQVINQEATENLSGTTLSLGWKSRKGTKGLDAFNVVDASKGIFEIYYTTEMLSNIGNIEASLILIDSNGRIESSAFTISVRPSTIDDESVESENSFTALTEALVKVNDFDAQLAETKTILNGKITKGKAEVTSADLSQDVKEQITGGSVAVVSKNSVVSDNVVDGQITPIKSPYYELTDDSNLFSPYNLIYGMSFNAVGDMFEAANRTIIDYVPVKAGVLYKTSGVRLNRVFNYNGGKENPTLIASFLGVPATFTPTQDGYVRIAIESTDPAVIATFKLAEESKFDATATDYKVRNKILRVSKDNLMKGSVGSDEVANRALDLHHMKFLNQSTNLFDKNNVELGVFINGGGSEVSNSSYFKSHRIDANGDTEWTIKNVRSYEIYNAAGNFVSGQNTGDNAAVRTITIPEDGYFIFSGYVSNLDNVQVNKGDEVLPYEPFYVTFPSLKLSDTQPNSDESGDIIVEKSGRSFVLKSKMENGEVIEIETMRDGSANGTFNFSSTKIGGNAIHSNNTDDIAPIRTFTTVGANHGYANIRKVTMSGHGKTTADLGSQWTDGQTTFVLLKIEGNDLYLAPPYTESSGMVTSTSIDPISNLRHVSGATHTATISIATIAGAQLYPSVKNISVKYLLDGEEITNDGIYQGQKVDIIEQYEILDYKSLIDFAKNNIGTPYQSGNVDGLVRLGNVYKYTKGLKCTTSHSMLALKKFRTGQCGFLQAIQIFLSGHSQVRYIPGITYPGLDFEAGLNLTNLTSNILIKPEHLNNASIPPSHYTDWLIDGSGNKKYGFTMGYIVDKTNSKNSDRVSNTSNYWDLRTTKKSYPIAIENKTLEAGDYLNFMGFRNYLVGEEVGKATNLNVVKDEKDTYLYAQFTAPNTESKNLVDGLGAGIEAIQSANLVSLSDTVDAFGMTLKASTTKAHGIYKIN